MPTSLRKYSRYSVTCCATFLCCTMFLGETSFAENISTEEWNISADKVVRYESPNSIVATGNVVLEKKEQIAKKKKEDGGLTSWTELLGEAPEAKEVTPEDLANEPTPKYETTVTISSDWMVYDMDLESIKAKGNVKIITDEDHLTAKEGTLNLTNETGKFTDAVVIRDEDSLHLEGETIEKTGFDTYRIVDGWAITCKIEEGETPPWSFSSTQTDIRPGGYAVLKHAKFNIKDVPVLYSPYLIVPIKNTRQTGFLFPEFSYSSNSGFGVNLPFFLNISESADITFFPEYFADRGFMPGAEFRYVSSESNKGVFTASYLDDQLSDPSETEYYEDTGYTHDNSDRYWIRGKADYDFGDGWQSRLDIDIASDEDYLTEFNSGYTGFDDTEDRYLDTFGRGFDDDTATERTNSYKILKSWSGQSLVGKMIAINDSDTQSDELVEVTTTDADTGETTTTYEEAETPLWTLPSVDYSGTVDAGFSDVTFSWDADYVNYWREEGLGGNRFDIQPALSTPIPLGQYLESRAEVSVRDTFYMVETYGDEEWEYDDTQNRLYAAFETEVATTLEKDFNFGSDPNSPLRHQLRPYLEYEYIPDVDEDEIPQYDDVDDIDEENTITYGIDNFFDHVKINNSGIDTLSDYAEFTIEQAYNFSGDANDTYDDDDDDDEDGDNPFSDIYAKLKWYPVKLTSFSYKTYYDVYDSEFNAHTVEGSYENNRGDYITLDYSFKNSSDINQINGSVGTTIFNSWLLAAEIEHSLEDEETNEAIGSITYQALCWSVKFQTKYTPDDTSFLVVFNLANIGLPLGADF